MDDEESGIDRKERTALTSIIRLMKYVKPYWLAYVGAIILGCFRFFCPITIAWIFGEAVQILSSAQANEIAATDAWPRIVKLFTIGCGIAIVTPIPAYLRVLVGAKASFKVIRDIRCDLYAHVQKLSHSFFDSNRSGSLTSRIMGDVQAVQPFLNQTLVQFWINVGLIVVVLGYFFSQSVVLGLLSICLVPIHVLIIRSIGVRVKRLAREVRQRMAWMSGNTQEKLAAATVVKAFTQERDEIQKFADDSETLVAMGIRNAKLQGLNQAAATTLNTMAPLLVILVGGHMGLFHPGTFSIGLIVQFVLMQGQIYGPFRNISQTQITVANALGAMDRIFDIFDTEPEVASSPGAIKARNIKGRIDFEHVSFSYPAATRIIDDFNVVVPPKTSLALVGPSGSGKSTIARLLNRFYDPNEGSIKVDGRSLKDYRVFSIRSQIGLVPQEPVLFSGTLLENILYGKPDATMAEVRAAASNANALDFIRELPDRFATQIGERGLILSGGQRQRIAIARAFLKNPPILILDEATSALDSESELVIQQALDRLMEDRTTVVIAHRLSTIRNADQIAVLEAGKLVELGCHNDLIAKDGLYARLCSHQELGVEDDAVIPAPRHDPLAPKAIPVTKE